MLNPPETVVAMTRVLEKAGHEAWCVGGAVRDALLGIPSLDWDLATSARPEEVRKLFRRTVPVGMEFGTVGVLDKDNVMHEVTTFRQDVETDGRHAVVRFGVSLEEDLARRDFTINAIAYSPSRDEIRDPFGGRADIEKKVLRAVGVPIERMQEDRLRALRAIRFASRFDFEIESHTWDAIVKSAPFMSRLSAERIKQEIEKTMDQVPCPSVAFTRWKESGAIDVLIPTLASVNRVDLRAIDFLSLPGPRTRPQRRSLRLIALFAGSRPGTVLATLKELRFSKADSNWISDIVNNWHQLGREMKETLVTEIPDDSTLRRWAGAAGRTQVAPLIRLAHAVWSAEREQGREVPSPSLVRDIYRRIVRIAYRDPIAIGDLAVNGTDLQEAGIQGKRLGIVLRALLKDVIADPALNTRDSLLKLAISK